MKTQADIPIRIISHNIRYATTSPFTGEKPWAERKPLILNELKYNTLYNAETFICLQEVLHTQLIDVMTGLGPEWDYIGVGRDDGAQAGEYSPILFRKAAWKVDVWKTVWLSETPDTPSKGWDAASVRIVTVGMFVHRASKQEVVGLCTHLDDQGVTARAEAAKLILRVVDESTTIHNSNNASDEGIPVFLAGDLNSEPSGEAFRILNAEGSALKAVKEGAEWWYGNKETHYTLANPDTLTKYKTAATIAEKVLKEVTGWIKADANIVELCERGDKLLEEETSKVYKGKKVSKGIGHCTTISPSSYVTPYTPLKSDTEEAATTLKEGEVVKIQLGAQIDGFPAIVCDSVIVGASDEVSGREADLFLATHYANELLLRLMLPPGLVPVEGTEEEQKKAASRRPYTQSQITQLLEKVTSAYECNLVESTTIWQFEHNEIEAKKKIILAPGEGVKGEGLPEVGEVWGVEMGVSLGTGKVKTIDGKRTTLHRRTATRYGLTRPSSRQLLSEVVKKYGTFPFSLRQLDDEKAAKVGVIECVRGGVLRQYEVVGDKGNEPVARLFSTIAVTKNGITRLAQPLAADVSKYKTDKKITDEEVLKILEQPIGKTSTKNRKKKKKPAKKAAAGGGAEESDDEEFLALTRTPHNPHSRNLTKLGFPLLLALAQISHSPCSLAQCADKAAVAVVAMPAVRKSRTSTPTTHGHSSPFDTEPRKKMQSSLDSWVEPAPQNPAPSFEEHGFAPAGVLSTMAPLGVPPTTKARQKARSLGEMLVKGPAISRQSAVFGEEEASTPELTPAPEVERDESEPMDEDDDLQMPFAEQDEEDDDDYKPKTHPKKKQKTSHGTKTPVRGKGPAHSKTPATAKSPAENGLRPTPSAAPAAATTQANVPARGLDAAMMQTIEIAVNDAHARSIRDNRPNVGIALRRLFNVGKTDAALAHALHGIINQKETAEDWSKFRSFVKSEKKKVKRELRVQKAEEVAKAVKTSTARGDGEVSSPAAGGEGAYPTNLEVQPVIIAPTDSSPADSSDDVEAVRANPHPFSTAPAFSATEASTPPAPRMGSKSPRKRAANGAPALSSEADVGADASTAPTPVPKSPAGSDSGLSEVDEDILHTGPPQPTLQANGNDTLAPIKKKNLGGRPKKPAISRSNSEKPPAKPSGKRFKQNVLRTAEQLAEDAEIVKRRQELAQDQQDRFGDQLSGYAPMSDMRFEDDETASMTESIAAMGPPGDINRPRRVGRPSARNSMTLQTSGMKRGRESSFFSSPHPDSAATSRPSTPAAVSHMPTKRLKLNNGQAGQAHQSARTKKSPVKNRDGPIAGIPHTGGGGSRQSGPDDNDPDSPPSESDDLCSACRGAGEFVCCETCPRVFHFLCCDPPRLDAPSGEFYCHVCEAKKKSAEDFAVETPLAPLFQSLESINSRAFALPTDIQTHFENVAARPDGSYYEDVKKFPLSKNSGYGYQRPDYTKVFDGDKPILCASCGQTSGGKRQMLKCDYCPGAVYWHLDCLDPPMANPPHINLESSHRDAWRCPRHIEHDFRSGLVAQNDISGAQDTVMVDAPFSRLGRKVRKPRHPQVIQPTFSRGIRNNGLIDVINDPDDDTDGEGNYVFGSEEKDSNSMVYRVPEKGLILDFVEKVKIGRISKAVKLAQSQAQRRSSMQNFAVRPIQQQQAALNLAKLASKETDIGLNENSVDALILSLTAEAPNAVVTAINTAAPPPVSDKEREELLKLQELIKARLGGATSS
ncbi:hypothetical protein BU23DRAFT_445408 [Bimuria novae-zelandiae CBS 107.79]|uniref:PHD-type domain-containing protein n=1 Tax=Bimuria novae-zelandiae CBS 107.79 TaxID=1447943 RepID=A0A6A5VT87_9PLEO|nr:hypothetical protein BU23DRAFT_445408 [Bimuria novae-zelandiae CBS 107.79]